MFPQKRLALGVNYKLGAKTTQAAVAVVTSDADECFRAPAKAKRSACDGLRINGLHTWSRIRGRFLDAYVKHPAIHAAFIDRSV